MKAWQWIVVAPVLLLLLGGIGLFAYVTLLHPKLGAGVHTVTVPVIDRVETLGSDGKLDTSASYLVVKVEATQIRLAPRQPDWGQVGRGDLVAVEVGGSGSAVQAYSWKRAEPEPSTSPPR